MADWGFEVDFDFDRRGDETWAQLKLLEERIGDQLYDPEPSFDGVLNNLSRQTLVVLQYEINRALDEHAKNLVKQTEQRDKMGDLKFTTAKDFVYPGSDCQV
jgi:hypothetical protein